MGEQKVLALEALLTIVVWLDPDIPSRPSLENAMGELSSAPSASVGGPRKARTMRTGSSPGRGWNPRPTLLALSFLALPLVVGTGCADRSVGPDELREAQLSLAAAFPASASQQARTVDGFRVAVSRPGQGVVAEESGTVGPEESSVTVVLTVQLEAPCESLLVLIELSASGEVWYRAEREHQVCAGSGNPLPTLQLEWVGPLIGLTPAQLSFSADQATNPSSQTFTVTNSGGGTLNWTAADEAPWLGLSPTSGALAPGASQTVTATVSSATLDAGQFQTTVVVTDPNAANSPQALPVSLTVIEVANSVIRGTVSAEGDGLAGVSVTLAGKESRSTTTDASGRFEVTGLTSGGYTVTIGNLPVGVSFAATTQNVSLGVNENRTVDFQGTYIRTSSVSGTVTADGAGLAGVTVTLSGTESRSTTTGQTGAYSFTGARAGTYTVAISGFPAGVSFQVTSRNASVGVGQQVVLDFAGSVIRNSSISGSVTVEGSPLANVSVTLGGAQSGSVATDASGRYAFTGLTDGSYTVTVSNYPTGVTFPSTTQTVSLGVDQSLTVDFPGSYIRTSSVIGTVTAGGMALEGVTVTLSGAESRATSTDASGNYQFAELRAGSYTVTISNLPAGTSFSTTSRSASVSVGETVRLDFAGTVIQLPSLEYSYIEACPAVIPRYEEVDWRATITVGVRDQFAQPIQGATILLSESPSLQECGVNPPLEDSFLITGPNGLAFTGYNSCWDNSGRAMTFTAQITANSSTITVQESDDLYVDLHRWGHVISIAGGNGQTVVAGQSASFSVSVLNSLGTPAQGLAVGWEVQGGNCFYGFTNTSGIAGMSLYIPPSTAPGFYRITANIADIDWQSEPWELVNVVFTYQVVAPATAPPAVTPSQESRGATSSQGTPRLRGTAVPAGGR
jgi:hypothetical protein